MSFTGKNWAKYLEYTTVPPTPGSNTYRFTMYARSTYPDAPAIIQVKVGSDVVGSANLTSDTSTWLKFEYDFTITASSTTTFNLTDLRLIAFGDDFVIDDISLVKLP